MTSSSIPTVDEKKPGDQNSLRLYIFLTHLKCFRISRLVLALIFPMMLETEYLGGMIITICKWSSWILYFSISISGWYWWISNNRRCTNDFNSSFNIRFLYFGIQTTWYWCRYAPCALNRIFMIWTYHIKQFLSFVLKERFHPRAYARGPQLKFDRSKNTACRCFCGHW